MNSTRPLAKTGSDVERLLLAAGAGERPEAESVRRTARALGIVPRAALVAATLGVALRASKWTSIVAWSSLSLVSVAGVVLVAHAGRSMRHAGAAVAAALDARMPAAPGSSAAAPATMAAPREAAAAIVPSETPAAIARGDAPALAAAETRAASRRVAPVAPAAANPLRDEAVALDGARSLLALGDAPGALARLGEYDRRFAGGSLREEALLLRIESLARTGDRTTATSLARRFLTAYPASVHGERVEAVLRDLSTSRVP
jgi:hypothetical protein